MSMDWLISDFIPKKSENSKFSTRKSFFYFRMPLTFRENPNTNKFRWLIIEGIFAAFLISIMLIFNHLK